MAIPQALIDAVPDYAWSDIAKMCKKAMIDLTISQSTSMMGHTIQKADMDSLLALYEKATEIAAAEAATDSGGGNVLVIRGNRV
jgi:hypothetical protein